MIRGSLISKLRRAWRFAVDGAWDVEPSSLSSIRSIGVKALRVLYLVFRGFCQDECPLHASALTFSTLMALVPILALSLALARGFGDAETAKSKIRAMVSDWTQRFNAGMIVGVPEGREPGTVSEGVEIHVSRPVDEYELSPSKLAAEIDGLVERAFEKVENISFTALGGVGLVFLLWLVVAVLGQVETSFNRVWGVSIGRSLWRRFTDYLSVVLILPLLVIAASSLPVFDFASRFLDESETNAIMTWVGSGFLKNAAVVLMTSLSFAFLIMFMPNARVRLLAGLAGGVVAGLLFIVWMWICASMQVGAVRYGKIYGSFAVVPIILAWVYVSWAIVLFGAEVAFAVQNCGTYRMEQGAHKASVQSRVALALSVILESGRAMIGRARGFETAAYAREKRVPVRFLNDIVDELVQAGFLGELSERKGRFVLLTSPDSLKVKDVIDAVINSGVKPEALGLGTADPRIEQVLVRAARGIDESLRQTSIQDLLADDSAEREQKTGC